MYELIQLSAHDYYIDCPAKIGVVEIGDNQVIIIDSGSDKDAGKKVLRILEGKGWKLKAIFNTHSHADHIGGNQLLQIRTGCEIYAPGIECDFTNHPILESACLYGGYPYDSLQHKFLMAQPSLALPLSKTVLPDGMEIIPLPGHSFEMVGFRTADDTIYLADCLSSEETLRKYGIGYLWNPGQYLETLENVKKLTAVKFVPAHAPAADSVVSLAQRNIDAVYSTAECIVKLCTSPVCFDILLQSVFNEFSLAMTAQQHALIGSTLRSYLSWLKRQGRVDCIIENNVMLWKAVQ